MATKLYLVPVGAAATAKANLNNSVAIQISRILHAGYLLKSNQTTLLFDPIFENPFSHNCYAYPSIEFDQEQIKKLTPDAVFISHHHDDHCSFVSLNLLDRKTPLYMYCIHDEIFVLLRELGFTNVTPLALDSTIKIKDFVVTTRRALDQDTDCLFHIENKGLNILNVVDSWIDDETLHILAKTSWDLILWPFQTMREVEVLTPHDAQTPERSLPPEWLEQLKILKPKAIVPSSCQFIQEEWSWQREFYFPITYKRFTSEINNLLPQTKIVRLNPGVSIVLDQKNIYPTSPIEWICPRGPQDIDYTINNDLTIPSTQEIAKHFPKLTSKQTEIIYKFCEQDLPKKLQETGPEHWMLKVYNHIGEEKIFSYSQEEPTWVTSIPAYKLYSALIEGESLSSLYLRVELKPKSADPLEDPLIVALYNGIFAGYQKAQLKRLTSSDISPNVYSSSQQNPFFHGAHMRFLF